MLKTAPETIDAYIAGFPKEIQKVLEQLRAAIQSAAPTAQETISYGMPTFTLYGNLVHFAAFKAHIGFYSVPSGFQPFQQALAAYTTGKGSVQFPLGKPLPLELVQQMVHIRVQQNTEQWNLKKEKTKTVKS